MPDLREEHVIFRYGTAVGVEGVKDASGATEGGNKGVIERGGRGW